ncbi:MAG: TonB-dependent receptor family protein, partial [Prevotella sp.]|nr:TonB-dependent receptor family protein [Prevotella sp.]
MMKQRTIIGIIFIVASNLFGGVSGWAQEQDSTKSVNKLVELQEVIVKGGLPNTRLKAGAMITRIEGTPLAQSGTLGEMLIKVPGMTGTDEAPEVLGKGSPLIYINGRKMRDASELKRLHSEDIRDVEVINAPGAQYDAQVRAVVRIRTRKQQGDGLSLDVTLANEHDLRYNFERPQVKSGANYRKNGVDVFGSVYYFHQDYRQYSTLWDKTLTPEKTFLQQGPYTMTWKNDQLTYTAGVNWQLSDNHSLGVRADLTHYLGGTNQVIYDEDVFENNVQIDHLHSHQTSDETKPLSLLTNTYYNGKVGQLGIDFNFDYMTSGTDTDRENVEQSQVNDDFVLSKSGTNSRLYATKLVLSYPLWKGTIEAGTEMTFAKRHNTYWIDKATIANTDADIQENNVAAFAEYGCDFGQYGNANIGLRYEHTLYDYDDAMNQDFLHRSMDEWFPTAAYSISLGKVQAALSYSIKTERPSFFAMNDAVTYISRYTLQAGNSQLLNERLRDLTLNLSYRWLTLTASYEHTKNAITQWTYISTTLPDATLVKHVNLDKPVNTLSAYLAVTPRIGIWSVNATAGIEKQDLYIDVTGPSGTYRIYCDKPRYTLNAFNTFTLKHGW